MRTKEDVVKELHFYTSHNHSREELEIWLRGLSNDELKIVFDEVHRMIDIVIQWWEKLLVPAIEGALGVIRHFVSGLSQETKEIMGIDE